MAEDTTEVKDSPPTQPSFKQYLQKKGRDVSELEAALEKPKLAKETRSMEGMTTTPKQELKRESLVKLTAKIEGTTPEKVEENLAQRKTEPAPRNEFRLEEEERRQAEENMPWFKRIFARQREKFPPAPPAPPTREAKTEVLKRQSHAGQAGSPELTPEERSRIQEINFPSSPLSAADRELLKKQGTAGIGGNPPLTPEERQRIIEINSRISSRPK